MGVLTHHDDLDLDENLSPAARAATARRTGVAAPAPAAVGAFVRRWKKTLIVLACLAVGAGGVAYMARGKGLKSTIRNALFGVPIKTLTYPKIGLTEPDDGVTNHPVDAPVKLHFRRGSPAIDAASVNGLTVRLIRAHDNKPVAAAVKFVAPGDIEVTPADPLDPRTQYQLVLSSGIKTAGTGKVLTPFLLSFQTAGTPDPDIKFAQQPLPTAAGHRFTSVKWGPDDRLWASSDDGQIFRFDVHAEGTLAEPTVYKTLQAHAGGPRLTTGFAFDPKSTAESPILWVSNSFYAYEDVPEFTSRMTRMSGPDLADVHDVVINLPRSSGDHTTNQPNFGPDGALYWPQPSNNGMGAPDAMWGMRPERGLTATILRLDVAGLKPDQTIDAKTPDVGGSYDPKAPGAPLTIFAYGVRLAYDTLWHSNGHLYVGVNGSASGCNIPKGPRSPGINSVAIAEDDWFFLIEQGKYYGHPNFLHNHFVLNGGNPSAEWDFAEVPQYPVGTQPEPDWTPAIYDMGQHISSNGMVEYKHDFFGGKLKNAVLICRYNRGSDVFAMIPSPDGRTIVKTYDGIPGLSNLKQPLDIAADPRNGNLYVSEFGLQRIVLAKPVH